MWHKARRAKNWMTAMAVLFAVVGAGVVLRDIALWGPEFVADFFVNEHITNEKIVLVMFGIAAVLFAFGVRKTEEFYR
ncbi:MAG: hypothetical protein ACE5JV_03915 [Nitrososphaerales archaeon]